MTINSNKFSPYKDIFNIYNLITKINNGYKLFFNKSNKKFYIFNTNNNNEICLTFTTFSENILQDLRFSRIENLNKNLELIEEFNENLLMKNQENLKQNSMDFVKENWHNFNRLKTK